MARIKSAQSKFVVKVIKVIDQLIGGIMTGFEARQLRGRKVIENHRCDCTPEPDGLSFEEEEDFYRNAELVVAFDADALENNGVCYCVTCGRQGIYKIGVHGAGWTTSQDSIIDSAKLSSVGDAPSPDTTIGLTSAPDVPDEERIWKVISIPAAGCNKTQAVVVVETPSFAQAFSVGAICASQDRGSETQTAIIDRVVQAIQMIEAAVDKASIPPPLDHARPGP